MESSQQKHVLVAVLDWGLGHATRCIPVIRKLIQSNCKVSIAGNGPSLQLLKLEFPNLTAHELPSYQINYPSHDFFIFHIFLISPRIFKAIVTEKREIERLHNLNQYDAIISDNRYGCYSKRVRSVLITHQLNLQLPSSLKWSSKPINFIIQQLIKRFNICWIPDFPDARLSGNLSKTINPKMKWVGVLSRFTSNEIVGEEKLIIGIVSGPEPQRKIFEEILISEFKKVNQPCILLRGLPLREQGEIRDGNIVLINHTSSYEMQRIISKGYIIISRSGYSTIMDLMVLGKKHVIFVPTPGQTEQEYLADEMSRKKVAVVQTQSKFNLFQSIHELKDYHGFDAGEPRSNLLDEAIQDLIGHYKSKV